MVAPSSHPTLFGEPDTTTAFATAYVPILLSKRGERSALRDAPGEAWDGMVPWVQLLARADRDDKEASKSPAEMILDIGDATRFNLIYLDVAGVKRMSRNSPRLSLEEIEAALAQAAHQGLPFIPVLPAGMGREGQLIVDVAKRVDRGMAVRVRPRGRSTDGSRDLARELIELGGAGLDLDLLVDFEYLAPDQLLTTRDVARIVAAYEAAGRWRSITVAVTTVPPSFAELVREGELIAIPRRDWQLYREFAAAGLDRIRFGSYGVQNCIPPDSGSSANMVAGVRFADAESLWVGRGRRKLAEMSGDEKAEAFAEIARAIVQLDGFVGRQCCPGDRYVEDVADGRILSRRHEEWRRAGTLHDFALTTRALAAMRARRAQPERRGARRLDAALRPASP
jgi:hypothetical protein